MKADGVRISDFSDREILAMMLDMGGVTCHGELAIRCFGVKPDDTDAYTRACRCVISRLVWMRRFGLVKKGEERGEWSVSEEGIALRRVTLVRTVSNAVANSNDNMMLEMAHEVGERFQRARPIAQTAMRRELQFQIGRRKR